MPGDHRSSREEDRQARSQEASSPEPASAELPSDMLSQVVAETAASLAKAEAADPALMAAMKQVALQFAGQPITVDPIGAALLEAVLRVQFPLFASRQTLLATTARTVAASLLADPAARLRVEHLWARLAEDAA